MKKTFTLIFCLIMAVSASIAQPKLREQGKPLSQTLRAKHEKANTKHDDKEQRAKRLQWLIQNQQLEKSSKQILKKLDECTSFWDDGEYPEYDKETYTYNAQGLLTEEIDYNKEMDSWVPNYKETLSYNENSKPIEYIEYSWDTETSQWQPSYKYTIQYHANGYVSQRAEYNWDSEFEVWVASNRTTATYNSNSKPITEIEEYWTGENWVYSEKTEFTYNANGYKSIETEYYWNEGTSAWINEDKSNYTYNESNNLTQRISYYWETGNWTENGKITLAYDTNGKLVENAHYYMSEGNWTGEYKGAYSYNASGNIIGYSDYSWDNADWMEDYRGTISYDSNSNLVEMFSTKWNSETSTWENSSRKEYVRDNSYTYNQILFPFGAFDYMWDINDNDDEFDLVDDSFYFSTMLNASNEYKWDSSLSDWLLRSNESFVYSDFTPTAVSIVSNQIGLYPNPATNYVIVEAENGFVELFDLQGRKVLSHSLNSGNRVSTQQLTSGIYIYSVNANGIISRGKLIVK